MKRLFALLGSLLVLPAFAEVAPVYYEEPIEYSEDMMSDEQTEEVQEQQSSNKVAPNAGSLNARSTAVRSSRSTNSTTRDNPSTRTKVTSRTASRQAVASRSVNSTNATEQNTVASRSRIKNTKTRVSARTSKPEANTARVAVNGSVGSAIKNTYSNSNNQLTDSGAALYTSSNVGARVGVNARRSIARLATGTTTSVTQSDVSTVTNDLESLTELTEYCKAQYSSCMDNYCNVLDDNQGRCSCSKNIKNYERVEQTLEEATNNLQTVVQQIKYIGLTGDQIDTLFTETEAELALSDYKSDTTTLAKSLKSIKDSILTVTPSKSSNSASASSGISLDMSGLINADFSSGFDMTAFLGNKNSSTNISNQRGETLYKTATQRCKANVLASCTAQGVDANVITNAYDLEIDKQCVQYERSLQEATNTVKQNVANATTILQQARLMLAQNKNSYNLRDCMAAVDSCMQDDYVCGDDYSLCLDPTGKYFNGTEVILGSTPGIAGGYVKNTTEITATNMDTWLSGGMYELYSVWNYQNSDSSAAANAWGDGTKETISDYIDVQLTSWASGDYARSTSSTDMAKFLLNKIGYIEKDKTGKETVHGMCAQVMQQCQDYSYSVKTNKKTEYKLDNDVIRLYLNNVLPKIRAKQDEILADYAEDCKSDVDSCLSSNGYNSENPNGTKSTAAINACRSYISSCMSATGAKPTDKLIIDPKKMSDWVIDQLDSITCDAGYYLPKNSTSCKECGTDDTCPGGTFDYSATTDQGKNQENSEQ
ncbi:MAG: hypothetical protein MJ156_02670 [Alphaproteobacteria bacterium]|nr:hypothetical protein [Alphaproteobacteria bacterium]